MAAFLETLAARARGQAPLLAVRGRARFEPPADAGGSTGSGASGPSDPSDPSDLSARAVASSADPLASGSRRSVEHGQTVEPVALEEFGAGQVGPGRTDLERTGLERTGLERTGAEQTASERADSPTVPPRPASTSPVGMPSIDAPHRQPARHSGELDQRQVGPEADAAIPTHVRGGRTESPEPVVLQALQPDSRQTARPSAGREDHPAAAWPTHPDSVRGASRRRPDGVPPARQLVTEHVVPALIRAGLVSPDGADDVRSASAWETGEVRETVGAAGVPEVHVHIGRVEVNQAPAPSQPAPSQPTPGPGPPARVRPRLPAVDHDAYLERRRRDAR